MFSSLKWYTNPFLIKLSQLRFSANNRLGLFKFCIVHSIAMATKENLKGQRGVLGAVQQKMNTLSSILWIFYICMLIFNCCKHIVLDLSHLVILEIGV